MLAIFCPSYHPSSFAAHTSLVCRLGPCGLCRKCLSPGILLYLLVNLSSWLSRKAVPGGGLGLRLEKRPRASGFALACQMDPSSDPGCTTIPAVWPSANDLIFSRCDFQGSLRCGCFSVGCPASRGIWRAWSTGVKLLTDCCI